jgi:hypothetical protein
VTTSSGDSSTYRRFRCGAAGDDRQRVGGEAAVASPRPRAVGGWQAKLEGGEETRGGRARDRSRHSAAKSEALDAA